MLLTFLNRLKKIGKSVPSTPFHNGINVIIQTQSHVDRVAPNNVGNKVKRRTFDKWFNTLVFLILQK